MTIRTAEAEWNGDLAHGSDQMRLESGAYDGPYDFSSRMDDGKAPVRTNCWAPPTPDVFR
jgi:hypothetical protein